MILTANRDGLIELAKGMIRAAMVLLDEFGFSKLCDPPKSLEQVVTLSRDFTLVDTVHSNSVPRDERKRAERRKKGRQENPLSVVTCAVAAIISLMIFVAGIERWVSLIFVSV